MYLFPAKISYGQRLVVVGEIRSICSLLTGYASAVRRRPAK